MTLTELYKQSEHYTDETMTATFALSYSNKAIAYINTEIGLVLPEFTDAAANYTALPKSWLLRLILPYLAYGIKTSETDLVEAGRFEQEFMAALASFREHYSEVLDAAYITDASSNIYQGSARNVNPGWFHGGW